MAKVDPFIHPLPLKIQNDPELRPFFEYWVRWSHDMWKRTGGGDDSIESTQNRDLYDSTALIGLFDHRDYFALKTTDFTTSGNEKYLCSAALTATLNDIPRESEMVTVKSSTTGSVIISGNGKNIDGNSTYTIVKQYESITLQYFSEIDEWIIV